MTGAWHTIAVRTEHVVCFKDYRGKDANRVVWKFDSALAGKIAEHLKQGAIEEGQWNEKRDSFTSHAPAGAQYFWFIAKDRVRQLPEARIG